LVQQCPDLLRFELTSWFRESNRSILRQARKFIRTMLNMSSLINCRDEEVAIEDISEIWKHVDPEEADEPVPAHKECIVTFMECLGAIVEKAMLLYEMDCNE